MARSNIVKYLEILQHILLSFDHLEMWTRPHVMPWRLTTHPPFLTFLESELSFLLCETYPSIGPSVPPLSGSLGSFLGFRFVSFTILSPASSLLTNSPSSKKKILPLFHLPLKSPPNGPLVFSCQRWEVNIYSLWLSTPFRLQLTHCSQILPHLLLKPLGDYTKASEVPKPMQALRSSSSPGFLLHWMVFIIP